MNGIDPGQSPQEFYDFCSSSDDGLFSTWAEHLFRLQVSARSFLRPKILEDLIAGGIPPIPAGDLVATFQERFNKSKNIGVFWDYENIRPDLRQFTGTEIVDALRRRLSIFGDVTQINLYCPDRIVAQGMQLPGAVIHNVPHMDRYEVADKMIIVDAIEFAFTNENAIICIISCDSDFSALISKLQMLGVRSIAITEDGKHVRSIGSVSTMVTLSWPSDFFHQRQRNVVGEVGLPPIAASPFVSNSNANNNTLKIPAPKSAGNSDNDDDENNNNKTNNNKQQQQPPSTPKTPFATTTNTSKNTTGTTNNNNVHPNAHLLLTPGTTETNSPESTSSTAAFSQFRSRSPHAMMSPLLRKNSSLFVSSAPSFTDEDVNEAQTDVQFLVDVLKRLQKEEGSRKINRSRVASILKRSLGSVSFTSVIARGVAEGTIEIGGRGGLAWIGLSKQATSETNTSVTSGTAAAPQPATPAPKQQQQQQQQQDKDVTDPTHFYLSYRLLKNRPNSQAILSIKPEDVAPFQIIDVPDVIDANKFTRRAFGPFDTEEMAYRFGVSLKDASFIVPRVVKGRPK